MNGKMIKVDDIGVYLSKHATPSREAVLLIHEWWGLNDQTKQIADRLADEGYVAVAIDLFDGKVAADRGQASRQMEEDDPKRSLAKLGRVLDWMRTSIEVEAERVGTLGFCFGGGYSLKCALHFPELVQAAVIFYGELETGTEISDCRAPLLGIFAKKDRWISPAKVDEFESVCRRSGVGLESHSFEADHAFFNPANENYDEKAAARAWSLTLAFFNQHLKVR